MTTQELQVCRLMLNRFATGLRSAKSTVEEASANIGLIAPALGWHVDDLNVLIDHMLDLVDEVEAIAERTLA